MSVSKLCLIPLDTEASQFLLLFEITRLEVASFEEGAVTKLNIIALVLNNCDLFEVIRQEVASCDGTFTNYIEENILNL